MGADVALAFAIEAARRGDAGVEALFTESLAALVRQAMAPEGGDATLQALVLRTQDPAVDEYVRLSAQAAADRRALRAMADAIAHPGKLRGMQHGAIREALASLHGLATAGDWNALRQAGMGWLPSSAAPALDRLERAETLRAEPGVQRYLALCEQRGPLAGTEAAAAQGRASTRAGGLAEEGTLHAFGAIAGLLETAAPGSGYRAVASLRTPRGFPGAVDKAKDEWDAAIVRRSGAAHSLEIVLLAEVKATPAAATPDFSRLLRGLQRLAQAQDAAAYPFPSAEGELQIAAASLRRLRPEGATLPPQVIYCCPAQAEAQVQMLSAATRAVLLAEPASLAYAQQLARGETAAHAQLLPVWHDLQRQPRLRSALNQYDTARRAREAMLFPGDLLAAVARSAHSG